MQNIGELTEEERNVESFITGRQWMSCKKCGKVRIVVESNPPYCSDCGGERVNCVICGTGKNWWIETFGYCSHRRYKCSNCGGDPFIPGSARSDWKDWSRARMIARFGPRIEGDKELLERYKGEVL